MLTEKGDNVSVYQQLVIDRSLALSDFFEMKRPLLLSQSEDVRDTAFSELVDLICSFPDDFLSEEQVGVLLDFLLGRLESSAASYAVQGIHHLVVRNKNLPADFETSLVHVMFRDGNVQGWDLEKRLMQYGIMEWLLLHRLKGLNAMGSDFVLSFIKSVGGERHPRCLPQVFRMFVIVARSFQLGPLVEDLFEVVACYFPVEFKQPSGDSPITQELLAQGCLRCLTAHPHFGPFCYMLIEEKFTDDDSTIEQKHDTCELLAEAARVFQPEDIVGHLEVILGGLSAVGLDPKSKTPECVPRALAAITRALSKSSTDSILKLGSQLIENLEPFVLQAEMGLTQRALSLLRCASSEGPAIRSMIYDRVIPWILMLVQGDVVNVKANRLEILQEGLLALTTWTKEIHDKGCDEVLLKFGTSLFASLDIARETAPNEALTTLYHCSASPSVQTAFLHLVGVLAEKDWVFVRSAVLKECEWSEFNTFSLICAVVHDESSFDEMEPDIMRFTTEHPSYDAFNVYLQMATRLSAVTPALLPRLVDHYRSVAFKMVSPSNEVIGAFAETMQSLGLLMNKESHAVLTEKIISTLESPQLLDMFCLFILQSQDPVVMRRVLALPVCGDQSACRLCTGIANQEKDVGSVLSLRTEVPFDIDCALSKGLLLCGKKEGLALFEELLARFYCESVANREELHDKLKDLLDFDSPVNNPERCLFHTTFLWRQRVTSQLSRIYVTAVKSADEAGKKHLMRLLPSILGPSIRHHSLEQQLDEFLPVFLVALSESQEARREVISVLPKFISALPPDKIQPVQARTIVESLTRVLLEERAPMNAVLDCLTSLELIPRCIAQGLTPDTIALVLRATIHTLGHSKRVVRRKAASVRNIWEAKRLE
uniref:MMS19 nucleotide excision repair protein n=1 Tax=Haemonchus contortus TaxID=6289 RepID=A0A7I5ECY5_HAECO